MNKTTLSIVSILALSGLGFAGGDIAPVEPIMEVPEVIESEHGLYLGLGFASMTLNNDLTDEEFSATGMILQAGYKFNAYFAVEGRYAFNISDVEYDAGNTLGVGMDDYPTDFSNAAIYLKPMYPIGDFNIYGLLGYGEVLLTDLPAGLGSADRAEDGFQWGLGAEYSINQNFAVFVDYTQIYDDSGFDYLAQQANIDANMWTLGVSYKF